MAAILLTFSAPAFSKDFVRGIRIGSTLLGKEIIQQLKSTEAASNTTTQRKERKSVISSDSLAEILSHMGIAEGEAHPVEIIDGSILEFKKRDAQSKAGFRNGTFTIYGRAAEFQNDGNLKTKIRMRVRVYMDVSEDMSTFIRSKTMKDWAHLEIKIKNPTPEERGGSNKYRVKVYDKDVLKLFNADPHSPLFDTLLAEIKNNALPLNKDPNQVGVVFDVIKRLSQLRAGNVEIGRAFIKPLEITSYVRESYSFTEKNYPIPSEGAKRRSKRWKFWTPKKIPPLEYVTRDIEYQVTIDYGVKAFLPKFLTSDQFIDTSRYFDPNFKVKKVAYPEHSVAIEFKEPVQVAKLPFHLRSQTHQFLTTELAQKMILDILPGYQVDRGKAGHLSRALNRL